MKTVNNVLIKCFILVLWFYQVTLNYVMFMLNSNKPIKVGQLQKLANQSILNGAFVIEMVNNCFNESQENFGCLIKRGTF